MAQKKIDIVTWLKNWFEQTSNKVTSWSVTTTNTNYPSEKLVKDSLDSKVDKVQGKGLSTEDYTTAEQTKLAGIEAEANKTIVDSALSNSSTNPVQNQAVNTALNKKAPTSHASTANTYGLGSTTKYGHVKTVNGLTTASHTDGEALSAYQGKVLMSTKYSKNNIVTISSTNTVDLNNYTTSDFYIFTPINMLQYVSNAPSDLDDSMFYLLVEKRDVNYVKQTLTSKMGITWVRTKISNTGWNRWREQQSGGNIDSGVNLLGQWSGYSNCSTTPVRTYSLYHSEPIDQIINSGVSDTSKYTDFLWIIRPTDFSYDDVFTLSFYAKGTDAKNFKTYFYGGSGYIGVKRISSNSTVSNSIGMSPSFGDGVTEFTLGSDWQKYYVTYKLNSSGTASIDKKIVIRVYGGTDFYLNSPKLERGYNATDYTPSNNVRNINYNIDFNDYKSEGHYWIWNSEQTSNTNAPDTQGGLLIVYNIPNGCIQLLYQYWTPEAEIYYRIYHSIAGWRSWQTLSVNGHTHSQYLTSHQDITGKEDKSNKVTSLSSSSTDTQYPSAKAVYDAVNGFITDLYDVMDCINVDFNNLDEIYLLDTVLDISNYNGLPSKNSSVVNDILRNNAVSQIGLNKEFTPSTKYTLEFDYYTSVSNRNGFYFGADPSLEDGAFMDYSDTGLQVIVDTSNTFVETFNGTSSPTRVYTHTSNLFTSGTHHIRIVRNNTNVTFYIDDVKLYTYTNAKYNTIGLDKWGDGYNTISIPIEMKIGG